MIRRTLLSMVAVFALTCMGSRAAMEEGTKELALTGAVDFDSAFDTQATLGVGLGYFVADGFQLGPIANFFYNDLVTTVTLGAFAEYNFVNVDSPVVPFVGAGALWGYGDLEDGGDDNTVIGSFRVGGKYFVAENWAIALTGVFDVAADDIYAEDDEDDLQDTDWRIELGIRTYF